MTSLADADERSRERSSGRGIAWQRPSLPRVAVILGLLVVAFFVSRGCQEDQIRVTEEQAVATAEGKVDFTSTQTQVRLLRQGLDRQPFWFVSLAIPVKGEDDKFKKLAIVQIDANTGAVVEIGGQRDARKKFDQ